MSTGVECKGVDLKVVVSSQNDDGDLGKMCGHLNDEGSCGCIAEPEINH